MDAVIRLTAADELSRQDHRDLLGAPPPTIRRWKEGAKVRQEPATDLRPPAANSLAARNYAELGASPYDEPGQRRLRSILMSSVLQIPSSTERKLSNLTGWSLAAANSLWCPSSR